MQKHKVEECLLLASHDSNDEGEGLLFLSVEGPILKPLELFGGEIGLGLQILERFAQEACRAIGVVVDSLADLGLYDFDDGG